MVLGRSPSPTVLYVEDDLSNQALVRAVMRQRPGIRLLVTGMGAEALELPTRELPTLILLDRHLPDMTGDEVLARLRATAATEDITVILVSGDTATPRPADAAHGVLAYLTKPYDIHQLLAHVDRVVTR